MSDKSRDDSMPEPSKQPTISLNKADFQCLSFYAGDELICEFYSDGRFEAGTAYTSAYEVARKFMEVIEPSHKTLIARARREAFEEAARMVESMGDRWLCHDQGGFGCDGPERASGEIATALRAKAGEG